MAAQIHICRCLEIVKFALFFMFHVYGHFPSKRAILCQMISKMSCDGSFNSRMNITCQKSRNVSLLQGCPPGYTADDRAIMCYKMLIPSTWNFSRGTIHCKSQNRGRLAVLDSEVKFKVIKSASAAVKRCVWVGGERDENGKFNHWHDGSKIRNDFWGRDEPNNPEEKCLSLFRFASQGLMLNDEACTSKCNIACEIPTV